MGQKATTAAAAVAATCCDSFPNSVSENIEFLNQKESRDDMSTNNEAMVDLTSKLLQGEKFFELGNHMSSLNVLFCELRCESLGGSFTPVALLKR